MRYNLDKVPLKLTSDQVPGPVSGCLETPSILLSHHGTGSPDIDSDGYRYTCPSSVSVCFVSGTQFHAVPTKLVFHAKGGYQKHGSSHWRRCLTALSCRRETLWTQYACLSRFRLSYVAGAPQVVIAKGTMGVFCGLSTEVTSQCRHAGSRNMSRRLLRCDSLERQKPLRNRFIDVGGSTLPPRVDSRWT
jgi:hypothetical protein